MSISARACWTFSQGNVAVHLFNHLKVCQLQRVRIMKGLPDTGDDTRVNQSTFLQPDMDPPVMSPEATKSAFQDPSFETARTNAN